MCDACDVIRINGMVCHELGCPYGRKRPKRRRDDLSARFPKGTQVTLSPQLALYKEGVRHGTVTRCSRGYVFIAPTFYGEQLPTVGLRPEHLEITPCEKN